MKAGAPLAIVDPDVVARRGITPHQPKLGDPNDSAPAVSPAPHFFATSKETEDDRRSAARQNNTTGPTQDQVDLDIRPRERRYDPLNMLMLVGALIFGVVFVVRLIEKFGQVIGSFR